MDGEGKVTRWALKKVLNSLRSLGENRCVPVRGLVVEKAWSFVQERWGRKVGETTHAERKSPATTHKDSASKRLRKEEARKISQPKNATLKKVLPSRQNKCGKRGNVGNHLEGYWGDRGVTSPVADELRGGVMGDRGGERHWRRVSRKTWINVQQREKRTGTTCLGK